MTDVYEKTTHGFRITVEPLFLADKSDPDLNRYVWAYHVVIENQSRQTYQLLTRHWRITDGNGTVQEVRGDGVVGEQPVLIPGDSFEYTSGTPLNTPSGIMVGSYQLESETGDRLDVAVPAFSLDSPHERSRVH